MPPREVPPAARVAGALFLLVAVWWSIFGDAADHGFTFDDEDYIANARQAQQDLSYLVRPGFDKPWASRIGVHLYVFVAYGLFGDQPGPYHLVNAGLHLLNALLLFYLVYRCQGRMETGFVAALLFLVNIMHYRAIYWISAVSLVLGLTFLLASLILLLHYFEGKRRAWLAGAVGSFAASVLCHQAMGIACLFPAILAAGRGRSRRSQAGMLLAFLLPGGGMLALERLVYGGSFSGHETYVLGGIHLFENLARYLFGLFASAHLDLAYHLELSLGTVEWIGGLSAALVVALGRWQGSRFWALWILLATIPFDFWARPSVFSRYFYFPAVGSSVLLAMGLVKLVAWLEHRRGRALAWGVIGGVLVAAVVVSGHELERKKSVQYYDAGKYQLLVKENPSRAIPPLEEAIRRDPRVPPRVYLWLGWAYHQEKRYYLAENILQQLLARQPHHARAHLLMSHILRAQGRHQEAGEWRARAYQLDPQVR